MFLKEEVTLPVAFLSHFRLRNPNINPPNFRLAETWTLVVFLQAQRLPFLHSSNIALDTLRGNDECIGFEDILNGKCILFWMLWEHLKVKFGNCKVLCLYGIRELNAQNTKKKLNSWRQRSTGGRRNKCYSAASCAEITLKYWVRQCLLVGWVSKGVEDYALRLYAFLPRNLWTTCTDFDRWRLQRYKVFISSIIKKKESLEGRYWTNEPEMWQGEGSLKLTHQFAVVWWATDWQLVCVE